MNVVIITSKDHIYANFTLKTLIDEGCFDNHRISVLEQDWVIPGKSKLEGLFTYFKTSGLDYVLNLFFKQSLFMLANRSSKLINRKKSFFYPYYLNDLKFFKRRILNQVNLKKSFNYIKRLKPDLILSIFSKEIIGSRLINLPQNGIINLHPAPLPFYRGVSPTFWILATRSKTAGATLHFIDKGVDTGKIISQNKFSTKKYNSEHDIYLTSAKKGVSQLKKFLKLLTQNKAVTSRVNPLKDSYYSLPTKKAVKSFRKNGYSFFSIKTFLKDF